MCALLLLLLMAKVLWAVAQLMGTQVISQKTMSMTSSVTAPLAAGSAVVAAAAAASAATAACAAAAAPIVASVAVLTTTVASCCNFGRMRPFARSPHRNADVTASVREELPPPVTPRTLAAIEADNDLLPRPCPRWGSDPGLAHALSTLSSPLHSFPLTIPWFEPHGMKTGSRARLPRDCGGQ